MEDTCVAAPQRLDQGVGGVMDVKLAAVTVLQRLSPPRDAEVLAVLGAFRDSLLLPQQERIWRAVALACEAILIEADAAHADDELAARGGGNREDATDNVSNTGSNSSDTASEQSGSSVSSSGSLQGETQDNVPAPRR